MATLERVSSARLRELLHYDPQTGVWTRLVTRGDRYNAETIAGSFVHGPWQIRVDGRYYRAPRLAFFYATGARPGFQARAVSLVSGDRAYSFTIKEYRERMQKGPTGFNRRFDFVACLSRSFLSCRALPCRRPRGSKKSRRSVTADRLVRQFQTV
jgi:hypothetical protein